MTSVKRRMAPSGTSGRRCLTGSQAHCSSTFLSITKNSTSGRQAEARAVGPPAGSVQHPLLGVSQKQGVQGPSQGREEVQGVASDDSTWAGVPNQAPRGLGEDGHTDASPITPVRRKARAPFGGRPGLRERGGVSPCPGPPPAPLPEPKSSQACEWSRSLIREAGWEPSLPGSGLYGWEICLKSLDAVLTACGGFQEMPGGLLGC